MKSHCVIGKRGNILKIRTDFVSNSSSSCFTIRKKYLTEKQIKAIWKHDMLGEKLGLEYYNDKWQIGEENEFITGETILDNFDMDKFLDIIGVNPKRINWDMYDFIFPEDKIEEIIDWEKLLDEIK